MSKYDYDLFTIGAGSGGTRASRMAANYGARVAVAEEYRVGGTCVIRGCVPKKLFVYASQFSEAFEDAAGFGWQVPKPTFSWGALVANKDKEIARLNGLYIKGLKSAGADIIQDRAVLTDAHTVHLVNQNRDVTAETILIATGAWPAMPEIPGIEHAITSNEAFHLDALPRRIAVVGGGYIAVEFAGIFNGLGVETALLYRGPEILRGFDDDIRAMLHAEIAKKGVDVRTECNVTAIEKKPDGTLALTLGKDGAMEVDAIMYATGRAPNTQNLGLDAAGIKTGPKGEVVVDAYSRTNVDNIYAVGDVTDRVNLTPVAIREGIAFAETVFNHNPRAVDHSLIPTAVFSQPEIGTVGLTEAQARERGDGIDIYKTAFRPMIATLSGRDEKMLMKLIVDAKTDKVLGAHMLGHGAGELAQTVGIALQMGATKAQFDATIAIHPTAAEELVTLREKYTPPAKAAE